MFVALLNVHMYNNKISTLIYDTYFAMSLAVPMFPLSETVVSCGHICIRAS